MRFLLLAGLLAACAGEAPAPEGDDVTQVRPTSTANKPTAKPTKALKVGTAPEIAYRMPTCDVATRIPLPPRPEIGVARDILDEVVRQHGLKADNPWAVSHAMLALGTDIVLDNGKPAVPFLFSEYAFEKRVGETDLVAFPRKRGEIRIEPHSDLLLKALTESGLGPEHAVEVSGEPHVLGDLYRHSLYRAWLEGGETSFDSWNDTPWALQSLATWAPEGLVWTAANGKEQSLDRFTSATVAKLVDGQRFLHEAKKTWEAAGSPTDRPPFAKRGQGIFKYTCGGAHLFQGAAYAVARGFGAEADREAVIREIDALIFRFDVELAQVDEGIKLQPKFRIPLLMQRLKFTGHTVETIHKLSALGLAPDSPEVRALAERAVAQLIATVAVLYDTQVFKNLSKMNDPANPQMYQMYLDFMGDSAHALRGLDLAVGRGTICR